MMKRFLCVFFVIELTSNVFSQTGYLHIDTAYEQLTVSLDDRIIGSSDDVHEIPVGNYTLSITNPNRGYWMFDDYACPIEITARDTLTIHPVFTRTLSIRSMPHAAQVYFNGKLIGSTPLYYTLTDTTRGTFEVSKEAYHSRLIDLSDIQTGGIYLYLDPIFEIMREQQESLHREQREHVRKKRIAYAYAALAAASGISAAYFNHQSDLKYHAYRRTGDLEKMDRLYDQSIKYEKISKASLGIFQVSFALSFYQLIQIAR